MAAPREPAGPVKGFELKLLASENGSKDWSSHWMFQKRRKHSKSTASPYSYAYKTIRRQQGTLCVKEPFLLPQGTLCFGYRHRWGWYGDALVKDRLDRVRRRLSRPPPSTSPQLVQTLLPVTFQVQRGVQKSFAALHRQECRSDEREHFRLQEQLIIHTQPLRNLG